MDILIGVVVVLVVLHLLGGLHSRVKHRRHGLRPRLYYTWGYGWYGSLRLPGGFRLGHKLLADLRRRPPERFRGHREKGTTIMALPIMTLEQREQALAKAREARSERSAALGDLKNRKMTLYEFLTSDSDVLRRTRVKQVVQALPGYGKTRAAEVLAKAKVDPDRRVAGLGSVQRATLADLTGSGA